MNTIIPYVPLNQYGILHPPLVEHPHNFPLMPPPNPSFPSTIPYPRASSFQIQEKITTLMANTGYDLIQQNGQRRLSPPPNWNLQQPPKGSEVFVGKLPRDMYEDEIHPIFSAVAPIYEIRLMVNFSGYNRGFAFITYFNPTDAWRAVKQLNDFEVRPDCHIGVSKSVDNCRLYIGGIPTEKTREEAWNELNENLQGITSIIMYPDRTDRALNRGFMFVEFCSHRAAAMAKRKMSPGTVQLWDKNVTVDWADPEPDIDPNVLSNVTKLFIRNIARTVTDKYIRRILLSFLPANAIERIYVADDFGFIHFSNRIHAQLAFDRINGIIVDGHQLEVQWARPKTYVQTTVENQMRFCRSLPPKFKKQHSESWGSRSSTSESES